jgi:hypothetical protein
MNSVPTEVLECISSTLDIVSMTQLGMVCKDTTFLAENAKKLVERDAYIVLQHTLSSLMQINTMLRDTYKRHDICKDILKNVAMSGITTSIMNVFTTFCFLMSRNEYSSDFVSSALEKVHNDDYLTDREKYVWTLFQEFWLGNTFHTSVFINTTSKNIIIDTKGQTQLCVTICESSCQSSQSSQSCHYFDINDAHGIVSLIWDTCGKKAFMNVNEVSVNVHRQYIVAKTPEAFQNYHTYCHVQDIQKPFFQLEEDMKKKIQSIIQHHNVNSHA